MKKILVVSNILALLIGAFVFVQIPITKPPTDLVIYKIENEFVRGDLDPDDLERLGFYKNCILSNERAIGISASRCWYAGLALALLVVINNEAIRSSIHEKKE